MWPFTSKKPKDPRQNHDFSSEDSEAGAEATKSKAELRRLKTELEATKMRAQHELDMLRIKADIEEAKQDLQDLTSDGEEEAPEGSGSMEDQLMTMMIAKFLGGQQQAAPQPTIIEAEQQQPAPDGEPTDQDLRELWNKLPTAYKNQALKSMRK